MAHWSRLSSSLCYHEITWLKSCPKSFKPVCYKRYFHDIFVLFKKLEQLLRFVNYMNKRHKNNKFLFETEKNNFFSFLDVKICREKDKFKTSVFRKDTFSGVYTNFGIFVALKHKFDLVHTLLHSFSDLVSLWCLIFPNFTLHKNAYPTKLVDKCVQKLLRICFFKNLFLPPFQNWNLG